MFPVTNGVRQVAVSSPTLFSFYINELFSEGLELALESITVSLPALDMQTICYFWQGTWEWPMENGIAKGTAWWQQEEITTAAFRFANLKSSTKFLSFHLPQAKGVLHLLR